MGNREGRGAKGMMKEENEKDRRRMEERGGEGREKEETRIEEKG